MGDCLKMPAPLRAAIVVLASLLVSFISHAQDLPDLIDKIRPSIVGVGTVEETRSPPNSLRGTGFVVGDGTIVATNAHVIAPDLDTKNNERLVAFVGRGRDTTIRGARVVARDDTHDVALLKIDGQALRAMEIGDVSKVREGDRIAFTGFPIGAILGLFPATHTGTVSAIVPIIIPAPNARFLSAADIRFLRKPYDIFQLDATAYPGNSGSPMYDANTGKVLGIVNKVFVKGKKEDVLKDPSGITYAMPANYIEPLLKKVSH